MLLDEKCQVLDFYAVFRLNMDKFCSCSISKAETESPPMLFESYGVAEEVEMNQAAVETGENRKYQRPGKRYNVTVNLSDSDAEDYDELARELKLSFSSFVKLGLLLLFWYYQKLEEGVVIKAVYPDGRITEPEILELLKLKALVKKKQDERKQEQGGEDG